jgi:orotate phosphoribosyltransferase
MTMPDLRRNKMEQYKKEFIEFMLDCGVLTFGDFITKSGRKTPFFINTGNYKTGKELSKLGEYYAHAIKENLGTDFDILFGPAYKGIPLSVTASISLSNLYGIDVAYCSNRKEIKDHGDTGILLGSKLKNGDRVVIIEDVTTAGTSINETMPILEAQGNVDVIGLIISVDRMERGQGTKSALTEIQEKYNIKTCAIVTMAEVIEYLHNRKINGKVILDNEIKQRIDEYYTLYGTTN